MFPILTPALPFVNSLFDLPPLEVSLIKEENRNRFTPLVALKNYIHLGKENKIFGDMLEFTTHRFNAHLISIKGFRFLSQKTTVLIAIMFLSVGLSAQNLFLEECFVGGVTTGGANTLGGVEGSICEIKWDDDYVLKSAYAITYRYGYPIDHTIAINGIEVIRNIADQIGAEIEEENTATRAFAVHIQNISDIISIEGNTLTIDLPVQPIISPISNEGYWGVHMVILYESPSITEPVCVRVYTADQSQESGQSYVFEKPDFAFDTPVLFSIYSDRLSEAESDRSRVRINNQTVGDIWTDDLFSGASTGVQGTFYYENSETFGLNGDTANTQVLRHDGIAVINEYLSPDVNQSLELFRVENFPTFGFNPHPAFLLTYTPECNVLENESQRSYSFCRGDTIELEAPAGYDTYQWTESGGLSDAAIANPLCFADSSRWYTLTMTSADGNTCDQTIPVFVEVYDNPIPSSLTVRSSLCPSNTGEVIANGTPGNQPITYSVNGTENNTGVFGDLTPGNYNLEIETATGCTWDTSVVVLLNPVHEASFTATPETGFSPLDVFFNNTSTQATDYQWLIDGVPISTSEDMSYAFPDSGSFVVSLIAYRLEETCADTATFTLRVEPGIQVLMPNIITPNGDGRNDALVAQVRGVASCRWVIYNRWGNEVATGSDGAPFQKVELWKPASDITAGQYTAVFIAEGLAGQVEKMVFEFTLTK